MKPLQQPGLPSRHLRWENFESRLQAGPPSTEPLQGSPRALFFIDPGGSRVGLRLFAAPESLPVSSLAELQILATGRGKRAYTELSTANPALYRDFYSMGCAIADRVQVDGQPIGDAIASTLKAWEDLLRRKPLLSDEKQIGLVGELLFLQRLAATRSWPEAIRAWHGPEAEEHDFSLRTQDVEVKTTRNEQRIHHIGSLTQLLPKPNRPLTLLSIQITAASQSKDSFSLAGLVASSIEAAPKRDAELLGSQLERQGWADADSQNYRRPYHLRSPLAAIPVDSHLPAIVPTTLAKLGKERLARLRGVEYWLNVDDLGVLDGAPGFAHHLFGA